jgi:cephalosporin hydroxylase
MTPYEQFKADGDAEIEAQNAPELWKKVQSFMLDEHKPKYIYHFEWLGRPVIQLPEDSVEFQELIFKIKPDLIIETGIAHGGSLMLSASMLALLDYSDAVSSKSLLDPAKPKRMVLGIDIDIRKHNKKAIEAHFLANRIKMIEGSSISPDIAQQVKEYASNFNTIMIFLDSNHTHEHVLQELRLYADLTTVNSYCVVSDTVIEDEPPPPPNRPTNRPWGKGNNPKTAVLEFLKANNNFVIDKHINNKLLLTSAIDGYLKRIK